MALSNKVTVRIFKENPYLVIKKTPYISKEISLGKFKCDKILENIDKLNEFKDDMDNLDSKLDFGRYEFSRIEFAHEEVSEILNRIDDIRYFVTVELDRIRRRRYVERLNSDRIEKLVNQPGFIDKVKN